MVDPISVNSSLVKRPVLQRELSREDFDSVINTNEKASDRNGIFGNKLMNFS